MGVARKRRSRPWCTASNEPFDLGRLPLFRSAIYRVGDDEHLLFLSMHHIISDQWSFGVISTELSTIYAARCAGEPDPLPPLPLQHVDYVAWHRQWLETDAHQRQLEYWKEQLAGLPVLDMPSDRVRPAMQSMRGASVIVPLSAELAAMTAQLSRQHNASPFMVFLAAFLTLLHRYSGASDLAVGSPIANRNWLESEHLISSFVNTLVLRVDVSGDPTFERSCRPRAVDDARCLRPPGSALRPARRASCARHAISAGRRCSRSSSTCRTRR